MAQERAEQLTALAGAYQKQVRREAAAVKRNAEEARLKAIGEIMLRCS